VQSEEWDWLDQFARDLTFHKIAKFDCDCFYTDTCLICRDASAENEPLEENPYTRFSQDELVDMKESAETMSPVCLVAAIVMFVLIFLSPFCSIAFVALAVIFFILAFVCFFLAILSSYFIIIPLIFLLLAFFFFCLGLLCLLLAIMGIFVFSYFLPVICAYICGLFVILWLYFERIKLYTTRALPDGAVSSSRAQESTDQSENSDLRAQEKTDQDNAQIGV